MAETRAHAAASTTEPTSPVARAAAPAPHRWLLFVHQLPSTPSNLRVRTWRRLQQLGAISLKQAVYVLPDSASAREDFEWLRTEATAAGGDAMVFTADHVDAWSGDALVEEFRRSRQEAYDALGKDVEKLLGRLSAKRRATGSRAPAVDRLLDTFRQRLSATEVIDYFGSAGRDRVVLLLKQLEEQSAKTGRRPGVSATTAAIDASAHRHRLWVTRPRPGVDRMASAWLIRRFIDRDARFGFAADQGSVPREGVPFDMFGVELSHRGESCTFETLCTVFEIDDAAVNRLATIVHDLDLKDGRFGAPEATTVGAVVDGLQRAHADDDALLAQGMILFEALYRTFEQSTRGPGPRKVARPKRPLRTGNTAASRRAKR